MVESGKSATIFRCIDLFLKKKNYLPLNPLLNKDFLQEKTQQGIINLGHLNYLLMFIDFGILE